LLTRPPLRSQLLPYTTLFRSVDATTGARTNFGISHAKIYYDPSWLAAGNGLIVTNPEVNGGRLQRQLGIVAYPHGTYRAITADTDRKSTRLNSSHRTISYAVF